MLPAQLFRAEHEQHDPEHGKCPWTKGDDSPYVANSFLICIFESCIGQYVLWSTYRMFVLWLDNSKVTESKHTHLPSDVLALSLWTVPDPIKRTKSFQMKQENSRSNSLKSVLTPVSEICLKRYYIRYLVKLWICRNPNLCIVLKPAQLSQPNGESKYWRLGSLNRRLNL